jgi:cytochrome c oxidase subunit 2
MQSVFETLGPDAAITAEIGWVLFAGGAAIFLAVMALASYAVFSKSKPLFLSEKTLIIGGGIVFPTVTLFILMLWSLARASGMHAPDPEALRIEVVGEQWWWRVRYPGFETANEIRVPVGRPVLLELTSADVIHSFWVPALGGKLDMIPGRTTRLRVRAERAGEVRGQCAEYCGGPHALMALHVVAVPEEEFHDWTSSQKIPAQRTNALFAANCGACHTVRGTAAAGTRGPDLTHVGTRLSIGAGLLPNSRGALAGWIASSQHLKPGNLMPSFEHFSGPELRELAAYLEGLR